MNFWTCQNRYRGNLRTLRALLLVFLICQLQPAAAAAESAKSLFFKAEAAYRTLKQHPDRLKYREHWLKCIERFQAVYRAAPQGPWAAAGLFWSGTLYYELYQRSYSANDRKEALDHFQRIVRRFPDSGYHDRARNAIDTITGGEGLAHAESGEAAPPQNRAGDEAAARKAYSAGQACYRELKRRPDRQKFRHNWKACIDDFQAAYQADPRGRYAAGSLYMTGQLYQHLHRWSHRDDDIEAATTHYRKVVGGYPDSRFHPRARAALAGLAPDEMPSPVVSREDPPSRNDESPPATPAGPRTTVTGLRFWSNPNYTRLVIDTDRETGFDYHMLKKDPAINKPQRLYVDLAHSRLGRQIEKIIPIDDDLLSNARAGQYTRDSVRVVVDIKSFEKYKVFSLKDPFRIVMDIWGTGSGPQDDSPPPVQQPTVKINPKQSTKSLAKQLNLGVSRVVIDPGHGGKDYGAPGYYKGVHEKHIVLSLAKELAQEVKRQLKCEVILTRYGDRFLTLEERTAIANTKNADLFISLHTNANRDRRAYGIETYYLNLATDDEAIEVAAMENATSKKNISDLQTILFDLMQNAKVNESSRLAGHIQYAMVKHLKGKGWSRIKNKGVKRAPFYVLLGADMPSVLIETSFISNPRECKRLQNPTYRQRLCEGIVAGIKNFIKESRPTALRTPGAPDDDSS